MHWHKFTTNTKSLMKLAYPILIAQLVQNLMGFADTVMAGRVSATDMAAVAIASSIWLPLILSVAGLIMALASIVSQFAGANKFDQVAKATQQTAWIALAIGLLFIALYFAIAPFIFENVSLDLVLKQLMFDYLTYIIWGAPGFFLYLVLRNYSEGLSHTKPTMIISLIGLIVNVPANYIFIYGEFGAPALGGAGCGIATAIVYWVMFLCTLGYTYFAKALSHAPLLTKFHPPSWSQIKGILAIGIPISLSLLFEVSLFSVVAIILAPFGAEIVASHQIALSFSGLVFMVPLSLSMAVTIRVGFAVGKNKHDEAKDICSYSVIFGVIIALLTATLSLVFRNQIAAIYTIDQQVIDLAVSLMFVAALFQFSDAIQVISAGALRGYKDTQAILYITFCSYWIVGLSVGLILGLTDWIVPNMGAKGFWIGFIVGLTTAAVFLAWRLKVVQRRYEYA